MISRNELDARYNAGLLADFVATLAAGRRIDARVPVHFGDAAAEILGRAVAELEHFAGTGATRLGPAPKPDPATIATYRDELTAQLRRALAISGRITWDEAIEGVRRMVAVNRKGWVSGWGKVEQIGHATFYGHVRTELIGGIPMVYLLEPKTEETTTRGELPEREVFFPLATLYRFTPMREREVLDLRRDRFAEYKPEKPTPEQAAREARATQLHRSLVAAGHLGMSQGELLAATEAQLAELDAWLAAGCPEPAPEIYREAVDTPF